MFHMLDTYVMCLNIGRDDDKRLLVIYIHHSVGKMKLGKTLKNMGNVLA